MLEIKTQKHIRKNASRKEKIDFEIMHALEKKLYELITEL